MCLALAWTEASLSLAINDENKPNKEASALGG